MQYQRVARSVWAILAEAAARGESARRENSGLGSLLDARCEYHAVLDVTVLLVL